MTTPNRQPKLIHVRNPLKRIEMTFEPAVPPDGPITDGPLIRVGEPLKRVTLHFESPSPMIAEVEMPLPAGEDGESVLGELRSLAGKLNETESLSGRPGVWVDGARSGVRDGKIVLILLPNDPADAIETCKRAADFLFAGVRTVAGATVRVFSADDPKTPVYEPSASPPDHDPLRSPSALSR